MSIDEFRIDLSDVDTKKRLPMTDVEHRALQNQMGQIAEMIGAEKFEEFAVKIIEANEELMRRLSPDGPALKMLDEYRIRKKRGFE